MTNKTFEQLQQACFKAQHDAEQADRLWQSALDNAGIERYSLGAKYDDRVKDFYAARLRAVVLMHEAQDAFRHAPETTTTESLERLAERMAVELDRQREQATGMFATVREMRRRLAEHATKGNQSS